MVWYPSHVELVEVGRKKLKLLIIGSGGREHALAWKLAKSHRVTKIYIAPGNGGTAKESKCENVLVQSPLNFAQEKNIDLTIVGPEAPLAEGIVDSFQAAGLRIWGPSKAAAQIEASKAFAKSFMERHHIPTAASETFSDFDEALNYLKAQNKLPVIKASGLAAGKGVILPRNLIEAEAALRAIMLKKKFGTAGEEVIIEECLEGQEASVLAFCDGQSIKVMPPAQDHKRALDGDKGLNTGGMGAYTPAPLITTELLQEITERIIQPAVSGLKAEGTPYVGVLYAGIILARSGSKALEFNCRFGDPEAQVLLPLLQTDLLDIIESSISGTLNSLEVNWQQSSAATVVLASKGYPEVYEKGKAITGLEAEEAIIFHAGTSLQNEQVVTSGGRVLNVVGVADNLKDALKKAYQAIEGIYFEGMHYRKDIGAKGLS